MEARTHPDGTTLYVDRTEPERGSKAPFLAVYRTEDGERRWGFFCTNCETFDNAVDAMGRIQCNQCRNFHKAEEWDAAHE
ncbi:DUF5816 domain-containing protein [Halomarina ordinaria]|uniref:DUF5816 domain-containing protein n=1 Tax=Halomarina ordinaria TaxID=3033939 RepID=A0ABD5U9I1_9EURY|nr:DUF5816 domain-containing protein [Halomarina sp. PSRA2]